MLGIAAKKKAPAKDFHVVWATCSTRATIIDVARAHVDEVIAAIKRRLALISHVVMAKSRPTQTGVEHSVVRLGTAARMRHIAIGTLVGMVCIQNSMPGSAVPANVKTANAARQ